MDNKLTIKLMDFTSTFVKEVEVNEGDDVEISIYTGDWIMESPVEVDTATDRLWDYFDGCVNFKATKNNVDKVNSCKSNYELLHLVFE